MHYIQHITHRTTLFITTLFLISLLVPTAYAADANFELSKKTTPLAVGAEAGIEHLFQVQNKKQTYAQSEIDGLMEFVMNCSYDPKDVEPVGRYDGPGIILKTTVDSSLAHILECFYNPQIPNYLLVPAVLRTGGWLPESDILTRGKGLWEELENLQEPIMLRGREFEVCTPDSFAESYYEYQLDRTLILTKHQGRNLFISVTQQDGPSEIGKKGAILNDSEWDYFYSGIDGINLGIVSWADTFTYGSGSIQLFVESEDGKSTDVFLFKWLKAGWAGMNMVERKHIYEGSLRFASSFKATVESDAFTPTELIAEIEAVKNMPVAEHDAQLKAYADAFEKKYMTSKKFKSKRSFRRVIKNGGYAHVLAAEGHGSTLLLEKLKCLIGMPTLVNLCQPESQPAVN